MLGNVWLIAKKNLSKSSHLKSTVSKMTVVSSFLFVITVLTLMLGFFSEGIMYYPEYSWDMSSNSSVLFVNAPDSFHRYLDSEVESVNGRKSWYYLEYGFAEKTEYYDFAGMNRLLREGPAFMSIVFPTDFDERIFTDDPSEIPQIITYFENGLNVYKTTHDDALQYLSDEYTRYLMEEEGIPFSGQPPFHVATEGNRFFGPDRSTTFRSNIGRMLVPLIVFIAALFSAMESGVDAIAGEKENGTFSALLLTPVSKLEIVLGNTLGVFLRTLIPCATLILLAALALGRTSPYDMLSLLLLVISLILLLSSLIIVISIMNRTVLSAQTAFLPIFLMLLVVCVMAMNETSNTASSNYMVPFLGHYLGMASTLTGNYSAVYLLIILLVSIVISALLIAVAVRLLGMERFSTTNDAASDYRERRERERLRDPRINYPAFPKTVLFGYRAVRFRSSYRMLTFHFTLPLLLLSIFQPLALIVPILLFLQSTDATAMIDSFAAMAAKMQLESAVVKSFELVGLLMRERSFILGMALSYVVIIVIYFFIVKKIEKNPLSSIGLPMGTGGIRKALLAYGRGLILGLSMISGVYLILLLSGQIRAGGISMTSSALPLFFAYVLMWIPQGASEEIMMRGYMMPRIAVKFGKAGAVGFTSLLFGLLHAGNIGFTPLALINLILIAVFFALLSWHTGEIFTVCAAHSAWNFTQGNLFGLHVSGSPAPAALLSTDYTDGAKAWLTGGDFGPEGGLAVTLVTVAAIAVLVHFSRKAMRTDGSRVIDPEDMTEAKTDPL